MDISYKKINNYEWIIRKYLKLLLNIKNAEEYKQGIEQIINKIYTLSSKEQNFCNLIDNFIIIDTSQSPAGANNVVKQLKIRQNGKIRIVQSIQKTFPPKYSFLPVNKKLILRKGLKENKKCIDAFIENDYWCLQLIDPFSEIFINSFMSIIYDLQASISVCKTYGYFLCDKKTTTDYEEFNVNQIIEESSFTIDYVIDTLELLNDNKDLILTDAILQLFYSLDNLKKWCGFVHFDLSPRNVMIANYNSTIPNCLKSIKYLGKNILKAKYLILNDSKNNIFITRNNKFILKIIDYGYSCLFFKYASNDSILKMNNEISVMLDFNKCLYEGTSLIKTIGQGSGFELYNTLKSNRTIENFYSDLYFFLIQIIWKIYNVNKQNNFPVFFQTLQNLFGLDDKIIRELILPIASYKESSNNIPYARYKRNIEKYINHYLIHNYNTLHRNYNFPIVNGKKIFMYNLQDDEMREIINKFRINNKFYFRDSNYFHLNIDPNFYNEIINEINPLWNLIKRFDNSIYKKSQQTMQTLIPSTMSSLKKYNVKINDYSRGFNDLNQYNKYLFDRKEYNGIDIYKFYKFIFQWNELLERPLQTTQNNIWFDGTNERQEIIGTLINVIELGNNAKINIDIVNKKINKFVLTKNEASHRHQLFINGNYFIIPYNYTNTLNPPYAPDKNGYPIGFYYKKTSKQIMGTICQFPPELLEHYAVIWGYNEPFRIYCSPWNDFKSFHETVSTQFNYAFVNDKTKTGTKNVENIKMRVNGENKDVLFGINVKPILEKNFLKKFGQYDFAFTTGPYLIKDNEIYFTESLLNQQMFHGDIPITYNLHNNDNYIFKTIDGINTTGTTIYGEKHSNWIMSHTIIGFQGNLFKFFLIEGRGFDLPGLDRVKIAKILHEKYGIQNAISLDGGFSSNAVYFSDSENGWRKIIDMSEERNLGLVITLTN